MEKGKFYIAVIGDIKGSRKATDRQDMQEQLNRTLKKANTLTMFPSAEKFTENPPAYYKSFLPSTTSVTPMTEKASTPAKKNENPVASNFMITLGDEFQGLLASTAHLMHIIDFIERSMFPTRLRFGIGIGEIHTPITQASPFGMDGPAYHIARDMITVLKASERMSGEPEANMRIGIQENDKLALPVNAALSLMSTIKDEWTEKQVQVINAFMGEGRMKQQTTAQVVGITQPSVQKALAASHFYTYHYALNAVSVALTDIQEST